MLSFQVDDMSCGHCVRAIKEAVRRLDPAAAVDVDLARHVVRVQSVELDAARVEAALAGAGYTALASRTTESASGQAPGCRGCAKASCRCVA